MLRNSRYVGKFMFEQSVVRCFSISSFSFRFWFSSTEHNILTWAYGKKKNGKESILKKKKIQCIKGYPLYKK